MKYCQLDNMITLSNCRESVLDIMVDVRASCGWAALIQEVIVTIIKMNSIIRMFIVLMEQN